MRPPVHNVFTLCGAIIGYQFLSMKAILLTLLTITSIAT